MSAEFYGAPGENCDRVMTGQYTILMAIFDQAPAENCKLLSSL